MRKLLILAFGFGVTMCLAVDARADLLGYWSADSNGGTGTVLSNDQGNGDLDGEIVNAEFTADGEGHTGLPGDYAVSFPGEDDDYVVIPPTEETFEEITITAWVSGFQVGDWAGLVVSRAAGQPIGLDIHALDGMVNYIWNNDSPATYSFISDLVIPEDEWTLVALTIDPDQATLYAGIKGGELELAVNEIPHDPQDNFWEWRWSEDDCCGGGRNFSGLMDDVSIWNEALSLEDMVALHSGAATPLTLRGGGGVQGDFNGDGVLNASDIDDLTGQSANGLNDAKYDLNGDAKVDVSDINVWIKDLYSSWVGDANLDGEFSSSDLVVVLSSGTYEVDVDSVWSSGDFDGDGRTNSSDLVVALADGGYELGPAAAVQAAMVPEPSSVLMVAMASFGLAFVARKRRLS